MVVLDLVRYKDKALMILTKNIYYKDLVIYVKYYFIIVFSLVIIMKDFTLVVLTLVRSISRSYYPKPDKALIILTKDISSHINIKDLVIYIYIYNSLIVYNYRPFHIIKKVKRLINSYNSIIIYINRYKGNIKTLLIHLLIMLLVPISMIAYLLTLQDNEENDFSLNKDINCNQIIIDSLNKERSQQVNKQLQVKGND